MKTKYPPTDKPLMVFDGDCGFCRYWLVKWKKLSKDHYNYEPFQAVAKDFKDIPYQQFQKAVQLIFTDGRVISGAAVAFYPYYEFGKVTFLYKWYNSGGVFKLLSDFCYRIVERNRGFFFKLSKVWFGKDPYANGLKIFLSRLVLLGVISLVIFYSANTLLQ